MPCYERRNGIKNKKNIEFPIIIMEIVDIAIWKIIKSKYKVISYIMAIKINDFAGGEKI